MINFAEAVKTTEGMQAAVEWMNTQKSEEAIYGLSPKYTRKFERARNLEQMQGEFRFLVELYFNGRCSRAGINVGRLPVEWVLEHGLLVNEAQLKNGTFIVWPR